MPGQFISPEGDLEQIFIDDYQMIDQYAATGSLWLWGGNGSGQLGDNTIVNKSSPVQTISIGTNWKQVAAGNDYVAAIKTDGALWLWGSNGYGQLGTNNQTPRSSPVQTIAGGTNWKLVACGWAHTAAIKTDGTLWLWGSSNSGALGDGQTAVNKLTPVQTVSGGNDWKQVSCGRYFTAAIKTDGTLWMWGANTSGQLGDNTTTPKSSPVQTVAGGTNWKQVGSGLGNHVAAIKTNGTLWVWGYNNLGQLGLNAGGNRSSPIQTVAAGTDWKQVATSDFNTVAIKTDGTLWTWGYNNVGQVGDNTTTARSSPVQTAAAGTNWKQAICAPARASAIYFYDAGNLYPSA